jgi:putative hydrolase
MDTPLNEQIAERLEEMAGLLGQQQANPFRVNAYRRAAQALRHLDQDLATLFEQRGQAGLISLPDVGKGIAGAIAELLTSGHWGQLERLRGNLDPEQLFQTVPGIGPDLARRIHDTLHIDSLEQLETAAFDGRLARVHGLGPRRVAALRASLAELLRRTRPAPAVPAAPELPLELLLSVDREYLGLAAKDKLPRIAPRRFNPSGEAWLPVLHTERGGWHFSAMFSNSALAHRLGPTTGW